MLNLGRACQFVGIVVLIVSEESFMEYQSADAVNVLVGVICAMLDKLIVL